MSWLSNIFTRGYDASEDLRFRRNLAWGRRSASDEDSMTGDSTRELIRQKAFDLHRNNGPVAGVCDRIALFTCGATGMVPQAEGEWGRQAEQWFMEWCARSDYRQRASLYDLQRQAVACRPTHGGIYFEKLDNGQIRPIECERIRQPQDGKQAEAYVDGVKVDRSNGRVISYRVHDRDAHGGFGMKHAEREILAENMLPVVRPAWRPDQVREIPDLAPVVPALQDIAEMNLYTLNTAKIQSKFVAFLKRVSGMAQLGKRGITNTDVGERQTVKVEGGEILEGFTNESMDMLASPTPGSNHIPYVKFQFALCASALGFPYEFFTLDLSGLDFSRQKGMLLLVNNAIRPWRKWLVDRMMQPLWNWRIPLAVAAGELPKAPVDGNGVSTWMRVEWQAPEELWIDRQEAMQADTLEIQAGLNTLTRAAKRRGNDLEQDIRTKAREIQMINRIAMEEGVDPKELSKMQIPGQTEAKPEEKQDDDKEEPTKKDESK